jgi:hypothetical protein
LKVEVIRQTVWPAPLALTATGHSFCKVKTGQ